MMKSAWRGAHRLCPEAGDVVSRRDDRHHLDRTAGEPERCGEHGVGPPPVEDLVQRGGQNRVLDVLLKLVALEVAAQQVTRAELAHAQLLAALRLLEGRGGPKLLAADYFQSSAPRRQT